MTPSSQSTPASDHHAATGPWTPLSQPTFRALWLAILVGNIGTWIHDFAASWVMAENTGSPLMVAAVQSATTLPAVLLAVIAGTLANIIDRRKYLILAQLWMLLVASTLALRARALALYILVFSPGLAVGSLGSGSMGQATSTTPALTFAAAGTALAAWFALRFKLVDANRVDVSQVQPWPNPLQDADAGTSIDNDRGPVLITIEYQVDLEQRERFLGLMQQLGHARRRNGAMEWLVAEDTTTPGTCLETFVDSSWLEHLRQHERVTADDHVLQQHVLEVLADAGAQPPRIRHFVGGAPCTAPLQRPDATDGDTPVLA